MGKGVNFIQGNEHGIIIILGVQGPGLGVRSVGNGQKKALDEKRGPRKKSGVKIGQ